MAYCPQCGREQKCGCEVCHHCGVPLVDVGPAHEKARTPAVSLVEEVAAPIIHEPEIHTEPAEEPEREKAPRAAREVLPPLLLILGCGVLLVALIEIIHTASDFVGPGVGTAPALKHVGYYLGSLLYSSSVRLMLGFALVSAGLFYSPPHPFSGRENWRRAVMAMGIAMAIVGIFCIFAAVLLIIPGSLSLLVRNLLPSLPTSLSVLLVLGFSLLAGSYVVTTRSGISRGSFGALEYREKRRD